MWQGENIFLNHIIFKWHFINNATCPAISKKIFIKNIAYFLAAVLI